MKKRIHLLAFLFISFTANSQADLIETIYFKSNSYTIDKKYYKTLDTISQQLSSNHFTYLKVFGYTDTLGTEKHNDILSEKRVKAVYQYLLSRSNFDTNRVYITWLGESADASDLHFPSANTQKKCVDIWVTFYKKQ